MILVTFFHLLTLSLELEEAVMQEGQLLRKPIINLVVKKEADQKFIFVVTEV